MNATTTRPSLWLAVLLTLAMIPVGCAGDGAHENAAGTGKQPVAAAPSAATSAMKDEPQAVSVQQTRKALLDQGFRIASSIPMSPHARDRARAQEQVVLACLELGFLDQASEYAHNIDGWRGGESLALVGQRYAKAGEPARAREYAKGALAVAPSDMGWSRDRVTTEVAKLYMQLGEASEALGMVAQVSPAELSQVEVARTANMPLDQLDAQADNFDKAIATKNFDLARGAIDGYMVWLGRVMDDAPRRDRALTAIDAAFQGLPLDLQVTYTVGLAEFLSTHGQPELARAQIARAADTFATTAFLAEDLAPLGATLARARIRLGDKDTARAELRRLRAEYDARYAEIVDLRRAMSLRALAEGFSELGDRASALSCYAAALDAGALNPNARPRAEDLSATCVSMAIAGIEPTPELLRRVDAIRTSLAEPW